MMTRTLAFTLLVLSAVPAFAQDAAQRSVTRVTLSVMSFDTDRPVVNVTTGPRADAPGPEMHFASYDLTSGEVVPPVPGGGVMDFILQLHTDMFAGLPGMLFLGAMGVLFVAAIVSGVVLYAPFMRRLEFGTVRASRPLTP